MSGGSLGAPPGAMGTGPTGPTPASPPPPSFPGLAVLTVSDPHPPQDHGVLLDASRSRPAEPLIGPPLYRFSFGDGTSQTEPSPYALHGYHRPGRYQAAVSLLGGTTPTAPSARVAVSVRDDQPPAVSIVAPHPRALLRVGARGLVFRGRASDPTGVRTVSLSMAYLGTSGLGHLSAVSCVWFDGRLLLRRRPCDRAITFSSPVHGGRWSRRVSSRARLPAGGYELRVSAVDGSGNRTPAFLTRLGTLALFTLR